MSEQYLPINSWAEDDRPREKLLEKGVASLSTNELFAILLRSGVGGESALGLARRILSDCGNDLNAVARLGARELMDKYKGIGIAKAASVIAAIEIGRRRKMEGIDPYPVIRSSQDAFFYIHSFLADLDHEEFWVIFLNRGNKITGSKRISAGGIDGTVIDVRLIFREALYMKATYIIIAHNHPSGTLKPSKDDRDITRKIHEGGLLLDIKLYDHLIVGNGAYLSFLDEGYLSF